MAPCGHHGYLTLPAGLQQGPPAFLANVDGLGAQHLRQRSAALQSNAHSVHEASQGRQGGPLRDGTESGDERRAGPRVGQRGAQFTGQFPAGPAGCPFQGGDRALAGTDRQGEEFGDSRELKGDQLLAPAHRPAQHEVPGQHAAKNSKHRKPREGERRRPEAGAQPQREQRNADRTGSRAPDHLLLPELIDAQRAAQCGQPPPDRRAATE